MAICLIRPMPWTNPLACRRPLRGRRPDCSLSPQQRGGSALFQRRRQRLQLRDKIGAQRVNHFNNRERDTGCDQAVFDRGGAGFIGDEGGQQAFQFHDIVLPYLPNVAGARAMHHHNPRLSKFGQFNLTTIAVGISVRFPASWLLEPCGNRRCAWATLARKALFRRFAPLHRHIVLRTIEALRAWLCHTGSSRTFWRRDHE